MGSTLTVDNIVGATTSSTTNIPGHVIQVVETRNSTQYTGSSTGTAVFMTELAITPKLATSKLFCNIHFSGISNGGNGRIEARMYLGTAAGSSDLGSLLSFGQTANSGAGTSNLNAMGLSHLTAAVGNTSARYLKAVAYKHDNGATWYFNQYSASKMCFSIMEIAQ